MQTPKEFLTRIEDPVMRRRVEDFTRAYEAARFGDRQRKPDGCRSFMRN